ncbi:MAG: hypothetical protein QOJ21_2175, partial [Solirubrobacteraceae bacterium]|nr:hypothetical protein [Solirubrobacteraceae bacterium]
GGDGDDTVAAADGEPDTIDCAGGGADAATVDGADTVTGCEAAPPAAAAPPQVSGEARAGATLTATAGSWVGQPPPSPVPQWLRCPGATCTPIAGADTLSYTATDADVGATLRARVTATNQFGTAQAESAPTAEVVARDAPAPATPPPTGTPPGAGTGTGTTPPGGASSGAPALGAAPSAPIPVGGATATAAATAGGAAPAAAPATPTAPAPAGTTAAAPLTRAVRAPTRIAARSLRERGVRVAVTCRPACRVTLTLARVAAPRRTLARRSVSVGPGTATIALRPSRATRVGRGALTVRAAFTGGATIVRSVAVR